MLEIPVSSIQVADSVVRDYCNGLIGCNMGDAMPGLFYVLGEHTAKTVQSQFPHLIEAANIKQRNWFAALVKMADVLWARSNGNPIVIADDMKMAAQQLGLNNKDWLANQTAFEMIRCVACGSLRNPNFPICGNCKYVVDREKAKELGILPTEAA